MIKKILIFFALITLIETANSQNNPQELKSFFNMTIGDSVLKKYTAPMNDAQVIKAGGADYTDSTEFVTFKSNDSSVYSVLDGTVTAIARIENFKIVIISDGNLFYTYSNLGSTRLKRGDLVKKDQLIGYATGNLDGEGPVLDFYVSDSSKNLLLTKKNFITRKDKKLTDHSIDPVNEPK